MDNSVQIIYYKLVERRDRLKQRRSGTRGLRLFGLLLLALFIFVAIKVGVEAYRYRVSKESFDQTDFYRMQEFSEQNSEKIMKALKSGKTDKLAKLIAGQPDVSEVMDFADWRNADFDNAVSWGAGSLSTAADEKGYIDIDEKFVVDTGDSKYVLYIETTTSRWGRKNEGVNAVAVCTYAYYDGLEDSWNGEKNDLTALAGTLFRDRNAAAEGSEAE